MKFKPFPVAQGPIAEFAVSNIQRWFEDYLRDIGYDADEYQWARYEDMPIWAPPSIARFYLLYFYAVSLPIVVIGILSGALKVPLFMVSFVYVVTIALYLVDVLLFTGARTQRRRDQVGDQRLAPQFIFLGLVSKALLFSIFALVATMFIVGMDS